MRRLLAGLVVILLGGLARPMAAQVAGSEPTEAIRVFLDCQFECDSQFLRTEINYVNWVLIGRYPTSTCWSPRRKQEAEAES